MAPDKKNPLTQTEQNAEEIRGIEKAFKWLLGEKGAPVAPSNEGAVNRASKAFSMILPQLFSVLADKVIEKIFHKKDENKPKKADKPTPESNNLEDTGQPSIPEGVDLGTPNTNSLSNLTTQDKKSLEDIKNTMGGLRQSETKDPEEIAKLQGNDWQQQAEASKDDNIENNIIATK